MGGSFWPQCLLLYYNSGRAVRCGQIAAGANRPAGDGDDLLPSFVLYLACHFSGCPLVDRPIKGYPLIGLR